jgi:hypothetical protein
VTMHQPTGDAHVDAVLAAPHLLHTDVKSTGTGVAYKQPRHTKNTGSGVRPFQTMDAPSGQLLATMNTAPKGIA